MGNKQGTTSKPAPPPRPAVKDEANTLFKNGQFGKAAQLYSSEIEGSEGLERACLLSNRSCCLLQCKKAQEAVVDAKEALMLRPTYTKAQARLSLAEAALAGKEAPPPAETARWADNVNVPDVTEAQLLKFNGTSGMPIFLAVRDRVYDMTDNGGWEFYSPGKSYQIFAGRDATVGLAKMSLLPGDICETNERGLKGEEAVKDLTDEEVEVLEDWVKKYEEKYVLVGNLVWEHTLQGATKPDGREGIVTKKPNYAPYDPDAPKQANGWPKHSNNAQVEDAVSRMLSLGKK